MSLLSSSNYRPLLISLFSIGLLLLLALPVPSSIQHRVRVIGPTVVWAGSPDETLTPPPNPPKKSARVAVVRPGVTITKSVTIPMRALLFKWWRVHWVMVRL